MWGRGLSVCVSCAFPFLFLFILFYSGLFALFVCLLSKDKGKKAWGWMSRGGGEDLRGGRGGKTVIRVYCMTKIFPIKGKVGAQLILMMQEAPPVQARSLQPS